MHMRKTWSGGVLLSLIFSLLLTGCGSGGGDEQAPITGTPEGFYTGTSSNGRTVWGAVLDNGQFWFVYSGIGNPGLVRGMIQGPYQAANGTFASADARDFSMDDGTRFLATVTGTYVPKQSLDGSSVVSVGGGASFALRYSPVSSAPPAALATVAGTYPTSLFGEGSLQGGQTLTVSADGTITFSDISTGSSGPGWLTTPCQFGGSTANLTPRTQANTFEFVVTNHCSNPVRTYSGIGLFDPTTNTLSLMAVDPDRNAAFVYSEAKL